MSMAHGLEVRVPFLDHRFAEAVMGIPDEVRFGALRKAVLQIPRLTLASLGFARDDTARGLASLGFARDDTGRVTKPLLVRAFTDRIPRELHRLPKRGFTLPMNEWMRGPLREFCLERLSSSALRDVGVDIGAAAELWKAFESGRARWSRAWALVVLGGFEC